MIPTRRDLRISLPADRLRDWHPEGPPVSHFMNTLSLFFPVGERFFIHAVRQFRDRIEDPDLAAAVTAFIGQEAMHGREHEAYNRLLQQAGYPVAELEQQVTELLERVKARTSARMQLATTMALEHITAMLADALLEDPAVLGDAEPNFARLWRWHALEETEHKAVAFDVWNATCGREPGAYPVRILALVLATAIFAAHVAGFLSRMEAADRQGPRTLRARLTGRLRLARFLFLSPGPIRRVVPQWLDYLRPGFHPWDHDNAHHLAQIEEVADPAAARAA